MDSSSSSEIDFEELVSDDLGPRAQEEATAAAVEEAEEAAEAVAEAEVMEAKPVAQEDAAAAAAVEEVAPLVNGSSRPPPWDDLSTARAMQGRRVRIWWADDGYYDGTIHWVYEVCAP